MKKNLVKTERIEFYAPRTEEHEIPKAKLGLVICEKCDAVYYKKFWHRNLRNYKSRREGRLSDSRRYVGASENLKEVPPVKFSLCPACEMIKNRQFEGEIIIKNIPIKIKSDLINLAKTFTARAYQRDPMDRLIAIKENEEGLRITTTENQLAVKLAKKIKETFKKAELKITYSPEPSDVVYIRLVFSH